MRCDARHQIPCSRCQATGHDCVVDTIDRRRNERRNQNKEQTRYSVYNEKSIIIPTDSYPDLTPFLQQVPASHQWGASTTEGQLANPALRFSILRRRI
jgi:hypothetical protein